MFQEEEGRKVTFPAPLQLRICSLIPVVFRLHCGQSPFPTPTAHPASSALEEGKGRKSSRHRVNGLLSLVFSSQSRSFGLPPHLPDKQTRPKWVGRLPKVSQLYVVSQGSNPARLAPAFLPHCVAPGRPRMGEAARLS